MSQAANDGDASDNGPTRREGGSVSATLAVASTLVAALGGSALTGAYTLQATEVQASSADQQATESFLRDQQLTAYSTFLQNANNLRQAELLHATLIREQVPSTQAVEESAEELLTLYTKCYDDAAGINLVGSPAALLAVSEYTTMHRDVIGLIIGPDRVEPSAEVASQIEAIANNTTPQQNLIGQARLDLGNEF